MDDASEIQSLESTPNQVQNTRAHFPIVGLGASAGGLQTLKRFFEGMPAESGMAFVVIMHLSPEHESHAASILQNTTHMPVKQVTEQVKVEPNHVYVIPPTKHLAMKDGSICLSDPERPMGQRVAIDLFFRTLADTHQTHAICVVLSGTGADGSVGVKRVKEAGGLAIVQDPQDSEYDAMPRNAINTGMIDFILPVNEIPKKLIELWQNMQRIQLPVEGEAPLVDESEAAEKALREVLINVRTRTGHDFTHYKRATILRRVERRMQVTAILKLPDYRDFLRANPAEAQLLLKDLLIGVTNFFRDRAAFDSFEREIVPLLFEGKTTGDVVRVWCAGCATGEEAYSVAMLLLEQAARLQYPPAIQVFATDIDEDALAAARAGGYSEAIEADVTPARLRQFFTKEAGGYRVNRELRGCVLFAVHNLIKDPPFSKLDAVTCRNLLIYLNREVQEQVFELFHFALRPGGFIFLGSSESTDSAPDLFIPSNKKYRLFRAQTVGRQARVVPTLPLEVPARRARGVTRGISPGHAIDERRRIAFGELHQQLVEQYTPPSLIINAEYEIVHLSENAGRFLRHIGGEPSLNLMKVVLPELRVELRIALFQAMQTGHSTEARRVKLERDGHKLYVNMIVCPAGAVEGEISYALVLFVETEEMIGEADKESPGDKQDAVVSGLEVEMQRLKNQLQTTIEQYETTVEELKSSNEEMQSVNEELRSASEELETSKEELQSVNEELSTVNQELKSKIEEVSDANDDLKNLMASTEIATVFLDRSLCIKRYTPRATDIFNLLPSDMGRPLAHITHKLDYQSLHQDAAKVISTLQKIEREVTGRDGRYFIARLLPYRTTQDRIDGVVLNFVDITERKRAEEAVRQSEERLQKAISIETVGVIYFNNRLEITDCNDAFLRMSGYTFDEIKAGRLSWETFTPEEFIEPSHRAIEEMNVEGITTPYEKEYIRKDGSRFWALFAGKRISENELVEFVTDITEQKQAEVALRESEARLALALEAAEMGTFLYHPLEDRGEPDARMLALFGLGESDTLNLAEALNKMIHPDDREYYAAQVAKSVDPNGDGKLYAEIRVVHSDKSVHWVAVTAQVNFEGDPPQPTRMYGTAADITVQKRAEKALRESEERFRLFVTAASEIIYRMNGDWSEMLSLEGKGFLADTENPNLTWLEEYIPDSDKAIAQAAIAEAIRTKTTFELEHRVIRADGTKGWAFSRAIPFLNERGEIVEWFGAASDITERKLAEQRQDFLFKLSDKLRLLSDPVEIQGVAMQALGQHLAVNRATYFEVLSDMDTLKSGRTYVNGVKEMPYMVKLSDFGDPMTRQYHRGEIVVANDIQADDRWSPELYEAFAAIQVRAAIGIPLIKNNRLVAIMGVHQATARNWSADEVALIEQVAERTWSAVERARAEKALRESEEHTRIAVEAGELATWEWNLTTNEVFWNERHFLIFGLEPRKEPVTPDEFFRHIHPDDRQWLAERLNSSIAERKVFDAEFRAVREDGVTRWMSGYGHVTEERNGQATRMSGVMSDITARKMAEVRLRESEKRFRATFEQANVGIVQISFDSQFLIVNPGFSKIVGYTEEECQHLTVKNVTHPEDYEAEKLVTDRLLAGEIAGYSLEKRYLQKGGAIVWGQMTATLVRRDSGEPYYLLAIIEDITERKRAEDDLRQLNQELEGRIAERTAALTKMNSNLQTEIAERMKAEQERAQILRRLVMAQEDERRRIARDLHDQFGQQLTAMLLKLGMLKEDCGPQEELCDQVESIATIARQLDQDVDFLVWALRPTALDDLGLQAALSNYAQNWAKHFNIAVDLQVTEMKDERLSSEIETVLYRIAQETLNNVAKHAKASSIGIVLNRRTNQISLIIEDDGIGFNTEDPTGANIKRFGLAGMRERAALVNGTVLIESSPGDGTTVIVRIPVSDSLIKENTNNG